MHEAKLPKVGSLIKTEDGDAEVVEANAITEMVTARVILPDNTVTMKKYTLSDIEVKMSAGGEEDEIVIQR